MRSPFSFGYAIKRVADEITFPVAAKLVRRSKRAVQFWSEDDTHGTPTIAQALALDIAYQRAGGEGAPIFESYAAQLGINLYDQSACPAVLTAQIGETMKEVGEAVHAALQVVQPSATMAAVHRALYEVGEAMRCISSVGRSLNAFLKPAGVAGSGSLGGTQQ